jgi:Lrp/AsnC family transcriptional regulator, leucine-responsive regulatory protein
MKPLDRIDRLILSILEENSRASYVEIAHRVGLSQTPCTERIKRLERDGFIKGYTVRLNPDLIDRGFTIFIQITFADSTNERFDRFAKAIQNMHEIVECHMLAGGYDCLLKVCVKDMASFRTFLIDKLSPVPGIAQTNSYAAIEVVKSETKLMLNE